MPRKIVLLWAVAVCAAQSLDELPQYKPQANVSGRIRIWGHGAAGHDYIETLVKHWEEGFRRYQPDVQFENKLAGTASAIGALYTGTGDLALLGREIWPSEIQASREVWHYEPLGIEITTGSYDVRNKDFALVVFVNKNNPLAKLTMAQVASIFGCGNIRTWGDLGVRGEWAGKPINVYGFEISRGFGYFFQQTVFRGGFKWNVSLVEFGDQRQSNGKLLDAGQRVTNALAQDRFGIAYASMLYTNPEVKPVALAAAENGPYVAATRETVRGRRYPLTRVIPMFLRKEPGKPVDPKLKEFLLYILSREGQQPVAADGGYLPLTSAVVREQRRKLEFTSAERK